MDEQGRPGQEAQAGRLLGKDSRLAKIRSLVEIAWVNVRLRAGPTPTIFSGSTLFKEAFFRDG